MENRDEVSYFEECEVLTAKIVYFFHDIQSRWWYFLVKPFLKKWFAKEYRFSRNGYLRLLFSPDIKQRIIEHNKL